MKITSCVVMHCTVAQQKQQSAAQAMPHGDAEGQGAGRSACAAPADELTGLSMWGRVRPGVAMDDLVYICTKIARQMDAQGLDRVFDAAEAATAAIEEARPLLARVVELVDEVRPGIPGGCLGVC